MLTALRTLRKGSRTAAPYASAVPGEAVATTARNPERPAQPSPVDAQKLVAAVTR